MQYSPTFSICYTADRYSPQHRDAVPTPCKRYVNAVIGVLLHKAPHNSQLAAVSPVPHMHAAAGCITPPAYLVLTVLPSSHY